MAATLSIVGTGRVGTTLGRLFSQQGVFSLEALVNTSEEAAQRASEFIQAGQATTSIREAGKSDFILISTQDNQIERASKTLEPHISSHTTLFHCSGSLSSSILKGRSERVASVHPAFVFSNPASAVESFHGALCGVEGEPGACSDLTEAFRKIGAETFALSSHHKSLYHASTVLSSNYVMALLDSAITILEKSGVPRNIASKLSITLMQSALDQSRALGARSALTGPISRGDADIVKTHLQALGDSDTELAEGYRSLGILALRMAQERGGLLAEQIAALDALLSIEEAE